MASGVVSHEEVLRHIHSFLDSFGYRDTLVALQAESGVPYNTIRVGNAAPSRGAPTSTPSPEGLERAVLGGNWSDVLYTYVDRLLLPHEVRATLYETIFEELLQLHGLQPAARALLSNAPVFADIKESAPSRLVRLEQMLASFDVVQWEESKKRRGSALTIEMQKKREVVLRLLRTAITFTSEPYDGALAAALFAAKPCSEAPGTHSLKRQREESQGSAAPVQSSQQAWSTPFLAYPIAAPRSITGRVNCTEERAVSCCLSLEDVHGPNGLPILVLGRANGAVEFADARNATTVGTTAAHADGVLSLAMDRASAPDADVCVWVAVGYRDGWVKVYNARTCKLVRRFSQVHALGVTSMAFTGARSEQLAGHSSFIVTGSFDTNIHVLGIATGAIRCTLSDGHFGAFVNALCALPLTAMAPQHVFLSGGNDGTLGCWAVDSDTGVAKRITPQKSVGALYKVPKEAVPLSLSVLPSDGAQGHERTEVALLTRSNVVLIVSVSWCMSEEHLQSPIQWVTLCAVEAATTLRYLSPHVTITAASAVPMLTLFASDNDGTVLLYNVDMSWRDEERWQSLGGAMKVVRPTDQSPVIIAEVGHAVHDLKVIGVWAEGQPPTVVATAPSLPTLYLMQ